MTLIKIIIRMTQKVLSSMSRCDQEPLPIIPKGKERKGKEIKGKERFLFYTPVFYCPLFTLRV